MVSKRRQAVRLILVVAVTTCAQLLIPSKQSFSQPTATEASAHYDKQSGWVFYQRGDLEQAVEYWLRAARNYESARMTADQIEVLTHLGQAYQSMGQYKASLKSLALALVLAEKVENRALLASVLANLGNLYLSTGPMEKASHYLHESLNLARQQGDRELTAIALNNLGNLFVAQKQNLEAIAAYSESARVAKTAGRQESLVAKTQINAAMAAIAAGQLKAAGDFLADAKALTQEMPPSSDKLFALLNIGLTYNDLRRYRPEAATALLLSAAEMLNDALRVAETIGDRRGESFALGYLGTLYENERRYEEALHVTRRAIVAAQLAHAPESLYRWQWQSARLLRENGNPDDAIAAFRRALQTLESVRQELVSGYGNPRVSFRDSAGGVYFEFVDLLLRRSAAVHTREQLEPLLSEARGAVELFKAAELRDYFRDDCVDAARSRITKLDILTANTVVIYPIVLRDRLELLVSLPTGLTRIAVPVTAELLTQEVRQFRAKLEKRTTREYLPHGQKLYDWLVRPLEQQISQLKVDTLVFVPDGPLRTIPLAALHDGKQFLISKYPVAVTPGLDLTDPKPLQRERIKILALGLTESVQGFPPLPHVSNELEAIEGIYGTNRLINNDFNVPKLEKELQDQQFNVVHIASHGQFSSDVEKTFLLTFDSKLTMDRLDQYIGLFRFRENPVELITLSACETAAGDDRAALGLAGIAIKAGARSALASLWFINDYATSTLVSEFYQQLQDPSISRAVALQRAQTKLLNNRGYQHPGYWSPFLLINNWL